MTTVESPLTAEEVGWALLWFIERMRSLGNSSVTAFLTYCPRPLHATAAAEALVLDFARVASQCQLDDGWRASADRLNRLADNLRPVFAAALSEDHYQAAGWRD